MFRLSSFFHHLVIKNKNDDSYKEQNHKSDELMKILMTWKRLCLLG